MNNLWCTNYSSVRTNTRFTVSTKHYIKSHLELQREITLIELAPSPYFFVSSICLAYMNMFARFDENPAMTLRVINEKH